MDDLKGLIGSSRKDLKRGLSEAGLLGEPDALYTEGTMRVGNPGVFKSRRIRSLAITQAYHNYVNERAAVRGYSIKLMEKGGTKDFWAMMLKCPKSTIQRKYNEAGVKKGPDDVCTGAEMQQIWPDMYNKRIEEIMKATETD